MIRGKIAKGGAAGEMPAQLASVRCTPLVHACNAVANLLFFLTSWPRETLPAVQNREWPIARHRLLKMGGQLGRDEWLRLVNRLLIDVKFRSIDRGSSKLQMRFSPFFIVATRHIGNALISSFFKISASNKNQNEEKTLQFHTQLITHIFYL